VIVECNACQTRFELEESLIPREGTQVRCSCCRQTFFLERPADLVPNGTKDPVAPTSLAHVPEVAAGDLSACFDEAVEEDRQETFEAWEVDPRGAEGSALQEGEVEAIAARPAPPSPPETGDGGELSTPATDAQKPKAEDVCSGESEQACVRGAEPESTRRPSVPRPPQPERLANLAGWIAVALLCAVGLSRGL